MDNCTNENVANPMYWRGPGTDTMKEAATARLTSQEISAIARTCNEETFSVDLAAVAWPILDCVRISYVHSYYCYGS